VTSAQKALNLKVFVMISSPALEDVLLQSSAARAVT
jgi:hypothetical protein